MANQLVTDVRNISFTQPAEEILDTQFSYYTIDAPSGYKWAGVFIVLVEDTVYAGEPLRPTPAVWDILQNGTQLVIRASPAQFVDPNDPESATWVYSPKYIVKASAVTA